MQHFNATALAITLSEYPANYWSFYYPKCFNFALSEDLYVARGDIKTKESFVSALF